MRKTKTSEKILIIFFGIILGLLILEIGLNILSLAYVSIQRYHKNDCMSCNITRILALGESTTAYIGQLPWPEQLENILNNKSKEKKYIVYNEGRPGIKTAYILSTLENNIGKYKPDIVITMMGVNDGSLLSSDKRFNKYDETYKVLFFHNIKLFKLANWIYINNMLKTFNDDCIEKDINLKEAEILFDKYFNETKNYYANSTLEKNALGYSMIGFFVHKIIGNIEDAKKLYSTAVVLDKKFFWPGLHLSGIYMDEKNENKAYCYLMHAYSLDPRNPTTIMYMNEYYLVFKNISSYWRINGLQIANVRSQDTEIIKYHYNKLYEILKNKKIKYYAMQYPTLNVSLIKSFFNGSEEITYISNKENFLSALAVRKYSDLFMDEIGLVCNPYFRGKFGHATGEGNRIIAENVANAILTSTN